MKEISKQETIVKINELHSKQVPFIFIISFDCTKNIVCPLDELDPDKILYDINGFTNTNSINVSNKDFKITKYPLSFDQFKRSFDKVHKELEIGNTYLTNLTQPTPVHSNFSLEEIFHISKAKYKLWIKDHFVVFSPEIFIRIEGNEISSFPMKGTIDADLPNAEQKLLNDSKEMAEHVTIVDLIRNDMSIHAEDVTVDRFRYIDEVKTHEKRLLQASSQITGNIKPDSADKTGELLFSLLPAGSISGAPKCKTLQIINSTENYDRGYYTGVFGMYNGHSIDSGVMIRYIEETDKGLVYKSGGGIHFLSDAKSEYQELIDKVYVPVH